MSEELDELNRLFTSKNVEDVIKFYDHFDTAEQLIEWMRKRPSAPMQIYEEEGDKDIVVVIPTADHNSKLAKNCVENIFKGQQIIFVESNGPFFNYARSCNFGLKYALKYNPKWIVLSNDDIDSDDNINKLKLELSKIDKNNTSLVLPNVILTYDAISKRRFPLFQFMILVMSHKKFYNNKLSYYISLYSKFLKLLLKFNASYTVVGNKRGVKLRNRIVKTIFNKRIKSFMCVGYFQIFNADFVRSSGGNVFDTIFINDFEDRDYSLRISDSKKRVVDYKIVPLGGGTQSLGKGLDRDFRDILNLAYFNSKIKSNL